MKGDDLTFDGDLPTLVVTKGGVPLKDQADGVRQFKEACAQSARTQAEQFFPGTGRMFAHSRKMAVTKEWLAGWDACLAELDKRGCFTRDAGAAQ
jgi:hypothetical protein